MAEEAATETVTEPVTTASDNGGEWRETFAGDNAEALEALKGFEAPTDLFNEFSTLKNRNWRDELAGDDEKFRKRLERFSKPTDFSKSYRDAETRIRSGELAKPLPEDATEKDIEKWRESNGIPKEAGGYLDSLPEGTVVGEDDKVILEDFLDRVHTKNANPEFVHEAIGWYNDFREKEQQATLEADSNDKEATEDALRDAWGSDYRANTNMVSALIAKTFGKENAETFMNARGMDGRGLMNNPEILDGLSRMARQINPIATLVGDTNDPTQSLEDEIKEIETSMRTNRAEYNKDEKKQARLRDLYEMRIKHGSAA